MESTTKVLVYKCLKKIGLNGFSGNITTAHSSYIALENIVGSMLTNESEVNRQKIYRNLTRQILVHIAKETAISYRVTITPAGAYRLTKASLDEIVIPSMDKWDGKWRLVSYDLPSSKKSERYELTRHLNRMGFLLLHKSLWVHPHACFEQLDRLLDALIIKKYVAFFEVAKFDTITSKVLMDKFQDKISY